MALHTLPLDFLKEAKQWYNIATRIRLPSITPPKKVSAQRIRLAFKNKQTSILSKLIYLYGQEQGQFTFNRIENKMRAFRKKKPLKIKQRDAHFNPLNRFTEKDTVLITYPDSIKETGKTNLKTLNQFANNRLKGAINTIHLLPFYPSSSDRGFAVTNYKKVDPQFGTWADINDLSKNFDLMFDGVFNHISSKSAWFKKYKDGNPLYTNHFIEFNKKNDISREDLKKIVRPRATELLTEVKTKKGKKYVWATFSKDQIDLNYKEPKVLLRIVDILFRYIRNGATLVRLDAINYLWKEIGTSCVHLKQTHVVIQLLRDILDLAAPSVSLITETNVPHAYNIKYFGNGRNEAQMVYNFALPPLTLYTFYKGTAKYIMRWADRLEKVSKYCTYFNFLASHDGIGVVPAARILPKREVEFMIKKAKKHGSLIQYKSNGDGSHEPYELNITWWNALNNENEKEDEDIQIKRFIASQAIMLSLKGVPGIYIHSLFGTENDTEAAKRSGISRDINRKDLSRRRIIKQLTKQTKTQRVFNEMKELLAIRSHQKTFHPDAEQKMVYDNDGVFSIVRTSIDKTEKMIVLINVTEKPQNWAINCKKLGIYEKSLYNVLKKRKILSLKKNISIKEFELTLEPYETMWIRSNE